MEVCLHSEHLAEVVDGLQERHEEPVVIVRDLIRGFLLPRLASQCQQKAEQIEAHKFRVASRFAVEDSVSSALTGLTLRVRSSPTKGSKQTEPC